MAVEVKNQAGGTVIFSDTENIAYERAIGASGELYIVARDPKDEKSDGVLFGGRYIEIVFSSSAWFTVRGSKFDRDISRLNSADV